MPSDQREKSLELTVCFSPLFYSLYTLSVILQLIQCDHKTNLMHPTYLRFQLRQAKKQDNVVMHFVIDTLIRGLFFLQRPDELGSVSSHGAHFREVRYK